MSVKIYQEEKKKRDEARALESASRNQARKNLIKIPIGEKRGLDEIHLLRVTPKLFEVGKSFRNAWNLVKANPGKTIGLFIFGFIIFLGSYCLFFLLALFVVTVAKFLGVHVDPLWAFYGMLFFFTSFMSGLGFSIYAPILLRLVRNQPVHLALDFYDLKLLFGAIIKTTLLFSILLMLCSMTLIGGVLFFLGASFSLVMVIDKNIVGMDAVRASFGVLKDRKADLGKFLLAALIVNALGLVVLFTLAVSVPITIIAFLTFYDSIVEPGNAYMIPKESDVDASIFS